MAANDARISQPTETSKFDLVLTRVVNAPRKLVFQAWTDPQHLARWWGPNGFSNPVCEMDARVGGKIRIHMRGPDGVVYPMAGVVEEIDEPARLVFVGSPLDEKGNSMFDVRNTVTFVERHGKTELTFQARVIKATAVAPQYLKGMEVGWTQSLDRLAAHVSSLSSPRNQGKEMQLAKKSAADTADREITATRLFDAPRDVVWKMWTDPEHVIQWWGPKGFTTTIQEMDVRPGGTWRLVMHGPDGRDYPNHIVYLEVVKPERLVYEHTPEQGSEPVRFVSTVTFVEKGKRTEISMQMLFPTAKHRNYVAESYKAVEGLSQTLGRLEEKLAAMTR